MKCLRHFYRAYMCRFLYYDSSLYFKNKRKVKTVIIYSADIANANTYVNAGSVKYSVEAFYMSSLDGDDRLKYLKDKILNDSNLTDEDIVNLTMIPLMKSNRDKSTQTINCIELADKIKNSEDKSKCTTLLMHINSVAYHVVVALNSLELISWR